MRRKELLAGFVVAGFLMSDVPNRWWSHLFVSGHESGRYWRTSRSLPYWPSSPSSVRSATSLSAAALGARRRLRRRDQFHLRRPRDAAPAVHLPTFLRHEGRRFDSSPLLFVMSASGLVVDRLFHLASLCPVRPHPLRAGNFALGWTLALNIVATGVW